MLNKSEFKRWMRSGSLRFALDGRTNAVGRPIARYDWRGTPIYYRPGTSDPALIYGILLKPARKVEYRIPRSVDPEVILDIGSNIGITSIYLADLFPRARIFAFEPIPANVELLSRNLAQYPNVRIMPVALGRQTGTVEILASDSPSNFGGYSFFPRGSDVTRRTTVEMRDVNAVLDELGIGQVDLIKIDTEGAEHDILTSFDSRMLSKTKWIIGELHGERDFEVLAFLSQWFDIETKKSLNKRLFMFRACNKSLTRSIGPKD